MILENSCGCNTALVSESWGTMRGDHEGRLTWISSVLINSTAQCDLATTSARAPYAPVHRVSPTIVQPPKESLRKQLSV